MHVGQGVVKDGRKAWTKGLSVRTHGGEVRMCVVLYDE